VSELQITNVDVATDAGGQSANPWLEQVLAIRMVDPQQLVAEVRRLPAGHPSVVDTHALADALTRSLAEFSEGVPVVVSERQPHYRSWWQRISDFSYALRVNVLFEDDIAFEVRVPDLSQEANGRRRVDAIDTDSVGLAAKTLHDLLDTFSGSRIGALAFDHSLPGFVDESCTGAYVLVPESSPRIHLTADFILYRDQRLAGVPGTDSVARATVRAFWPEVERLMIAKEPAEVAALNRMVAEALGVSSDLHGLFPDDGRKPTDGQLQARVAISNAFPAAFGTRPCASRRELMSEIFVDAYLGGTVDESTGTASEHQVVGVLRAHLDSMLGSQLVH